MGLETLYELYKDSAKSRLHEIFIYLHSIFLEEKFKCIGRQYDASQNNQDIKGSELLPSGWNDDNNTVELFYIRTTEKDVYKVLALKESDTCLLHLISCVPNCDKSAFVEIDLCDFVYETSSKTVSQVYKNLDGFKKVVVEKLLKVVIPPSGADVDAVKVDPHPRASRDYGHPYGDREGPSGSFDPLRDYGRADLDPFYVEPGGLGTSPPGGMVFDPFRSVRPRAPDRFSGLIQPLPRGSVPPGARFDPFGPPGTGGLDPDIERRPHFNDDFYS